MINNEKTTSYIMLPFYLYIMCIDFFIDIFYWKPNYKNIKKYFSYICLYLDHLSYIYAREIITLPDKKKHVQEINKLFLIVNHFYQKIIMSFDRLPWFISKELEVQCYVAYITEYIISHFYNNLSHMLNVDYSLHVEELNEIKDIFQKIARYNRTYNKNIMHVSFDGAIFINPPKEHKSSIKLSPIEYEKTKINDAFYALSEFNFSV